jgi:hypothetical protein
MQEEEEEEEEEELHTLLTSALDLGEWSTFRSGKFTCGKPPRTH